MNELNNMNTEINEGSETTMLDDEGTDETEIKKESEKADESADKKKAEHEAAEAKRKAEWDEKQAKKKAESDKKFAEITAMSDDAIMNASVQKTGAELERVTRRNMKMCTAEHIQTLCLDDSEFARKTMYPNKTMINCFKYINQKAQEYLKEEMEMNDEKTTGNGYGGDVPDDLCYKWAEDYYNDQNAEVDKDKDDKFVAKPYYGGGSSKSKKKEDAKSTKKSASAKSENDDQVQLFGDGEGA